LILRGGLIGCGKIVRDIHVSVWQSIGGLHIQSVCDPDEAARSEVAGRLGDARAYSDVNRMLDENQDLDFVSIATPGFTHYDLSKRAIHRGLNVIVEKPLALSLADARALVEQATLANVRLCVGQTYRYRDSVLVIRRAIEQGQVGRIYQVDTTHHGESIFNDQASWIWSEQEHRVLLYEHAIHFLDLQVYFAGPLKRIVGLDVRRDEHVKATTHVHALIEHTSGVIGHIDLQLFASSNYTQIEVFGTANDATLKFSPDGWQLYSGRVNPLDEMLAGFKRTAGFVMPTLVAKFRPPALPRKARSHHRVFSGFVRALHDGSLVLPVSGEDVLPTMELLEALAVPTYGGAL